MSQFMSHCKLRNSERNVTLEIQCSHYTSIQTHHLSIERLHSKKISETITKILRVICRVNKRYKCDRVWDRCVMAGTKK